MKKKFLITVLSALVLSGCEFSIGSMNFKFGKSKEKPKENIEQKEEQNNNNAPSENNTGDQGDNNQQGDNNDGGNNNEQEYTATIKFYGSDFSVYASAAGVQADDSGYSENVTKLKNYCDSFLEYENLITKLNCTCLNTAEYNGETVLCVGTGYYQNNKFSDGLLKWTSKEKIYKVEISATNYFKENSYSGNIIDYPAHVWIDSDDHPLTCEVGLNPQYQSFTKEYDEGTTSFSIKSTGARVLLRELTITWRG